MIYLSLILFLFLSRSVYAVDPPPSLLEVGVCTHFYGYLKDTKLYDKLGMLGARYVRDDFFWQWAEEVKGTFYIDPRISEYIDKLNSLKIRPIMVLAYSNKNYSPDNNNNTGPNTPEMIKGFSDYVSFMVSTFKGKVYAWEIWNEPDWGFWKPLPNSRDYTLLVKQAAPIIRKIDPQALIVAGAFVKPNWEFLNSLKEEGALKDVDAISFHWYTFPKPPDQGWKAMKMDLINVQSFVQEIKRLGKHAWITEMGYPTSTNKHGVSEEQQAEYLQKQIELAGNMGVEVCIIYDLIDDGPDPGNTGHRHGLFRQDGTPKPAATYLEIMQKRSQ